jgi:hypothetical protein
LRPGASLRRGNSNTRYDVRHKGRLPIMDAESCLQSSYSAECGNARSHRMISVTRSASDCEWRINVSEGHTVRDLNSPRTYYEEISPALTIISHLPVC